MGFSFRNLILKLITTPSSGVGYGNRGGLIHHLECKEGLLILIEPDRKGRGRLLTKLYFLADFVEPWFE